MCREQTGRSGNRESKGQDDPKPERPGDVAVGGDVFVKKFGDSGESLMITTTSRDC